MNDPHKSAEKEFLDLVEGWRKEYKSSGYDPLPFLESCADIFEDQTIQFHSGDPDPFDDRHPEYIQPGCTFGKLLVALAKCDDLLDELVTKYIRSGGTNPANPSAISVATTRLLLAAKPGLELNIIYKENEWLVDLLFSWTKDADDPLRTYATGLVVGAMEPQIVNDDYARLITILVQRLWNYVKPETFSEASAKVIINETKVTGRTFSDISGPCSKVEANSFALGTNSRSKRRLSDHSMYPASKKLLFDHKMSESDLAPVSVGEDVAVPFQMWRGDLDNELSNSSWSEQMPFVVGCSYSLKPPLSPNVCQRFILDFLKCLGEYQDLLSVFLELKVLDLINIYLKEKKSDGLLTFKALEFLASLLCHNKVAIEFIELNGIQNLLSVQRPSMGSTGVSLCLYYLAYRKDAMERVCQLPSRVLADMVRYVVWLLECSHESGRSHAALFFSISFSFRIILGLFDQMNALRCLLNMISTSPPILNSANDDPESEDNVDIHFTRQTARTVCSALKKYFEAHLVIKVYNVQRSLSRADERYFSMQSVPRYKPMACSREQLFEYLEFFVAVQENNPYIISSHLTQWQPLQDFMRLDGLSLILKVVVLACDWSSFAARIEVVRSALDVLAILTLSPKAQFALCDPDLMSRLNCDETGMDIVLSVAEGERFSGHEGEAQKSALAVIVNCVCGFQTRYDGSIGMFFKGTPQRRVSSRSMEESREKLWKCVQNNNGIKILLSLLVVNYPAQHADDLRYLACKALLGLSNYRPVTQIMSKLPFFINGQIQSITREPVLHDKKRQHAKLCKCIEALIERVSGRPSTLDLDLETVRKWHIISETHMQYNNKEVLQMLHNHLVWSGLTHSADVLAKEAGLVMSDASTPTKSNCFVFPSPQQPKSSSRAHGSHFEMGQEFGGSGDATRSGKSKRISFSRGAHAYAETPTPSSVINVLVPTPHKRSRSRPKSGQSSVYVNVCKQSRFKLSNTGVVTVTPKSFSHDKQDACCPPTLNSVIEEHFKHQHSRCRNPVVTVPEFSLCRPHCCPEPRYRVEAPTNATKRACYRQGICPRWGGIGGASCDRQLIYSRYKPGYVFKGTEDRKVPCCSVAFMPGDDKLLLGDYQGDLTVHSLHTDEDHIVQGVAGAPITFIEPAKNGGSLLVTSEGVWNTDCSLYSTGEQFKHKVSYEDVYCVEFSKLNQDKVIGTKDHKATIFDVNTGQVVDTFEKSDMASNYTSNRATFSYNDELVLSDGLLWDVRIPHTQPIHKFDKFNSTVSGVFHPRSLEVLINTEIWDLRNFHLLHTVPALDQCSLVFNHQGNILYAVKKKKNVDIDESEDETDRVASAFRTLDGFDYKQLAFVAVRHHIYDLAVDRMDFNVAVVETLVGEDSWEEPRMSVCRLYDIGMSRGDDDDDESNFEEHSVSSSSGTGSDDRSSTNGGSSHGDGNELDLEDEIFEDSDSADSTESDIYNADDDDEWETAEDEDLSSLDDD